MFSRIDARNDELFDAWFDVLHRSELQRDQGRGSGWWPDEWRARAVDETAPIYTQLFSYGDDLARPVAVGALEVTRDDNLHWIRGDLFVDPDHRRLGHGAVLLRHLEECARNLDRREILFWVMEGGHEYAHGPNRHFAPAQGYENIEESIRRDLAWPRPAGELDRLEAEWLPMAADYELLTWKSSSPEQYLDDRAHLSAVMPVEVPDAGFGIEEEKWDRHRVRLHEERINEMGRDLLASAALHKRSGTLVAFSELTVSREQPDTAYQWDTLVLRAHRGHRLGGLMKIATMRMLETGGYATQRISTFNASTNTAMIAVNELFGAHVTGCTVTWRKSLGEPPA